MKNTTAIIIALVLAASTAQAQVLKKINLDSTSGISPKIETDTAVKAEGTGAIKITTQWPVTVCLAEVSEPDIENAKLMYAAKIKSELDGTAFLEMWVHINKGQYFSRSLNDTVSGTIDWKKISTPFVFQKGQKPDKVTLNIVINGKGTVWVDDIVLTREPL